jgi:acyl-CoA hydrolase
VNARVLSLLESGGRNLGIHTEMLTDGIIDRYQARVVTGAKTSQPGKFRVQRLLPVQRTGTTRSITSPIFHASRST